MNDSSPAVRRFAMNRKGRDFVVGDLHGAFRVLDEALAKVRFDPGCDRLFSVGDLIDRGPKSTRCLEFLGKPWFHAVRGNHEDDLLDFYLHPVEEDALRITVQWAPYLAWWLDVPQEQRQEILSALRRLPLAIEVALPQGHAGIVHADVPAGMSWDTFIARLESGDRRVRNAALWGRARVNQAIDEAVPGVSRVFVGHTILWEGAQRYGNVFAIDTGAVFSQLCTEEMANSLDDGFLTLVNLAAEEEAILTPGRAGSIDLRGVTSPETAVNPEAEDLPISLTLGSNW